ncbi:lysis system i-spanin subunit Rz [Jeongeupia naejangsanensis]|uniref:Lysis protein n=1 Tax=Jeongeupia naejangsanensis TaxID=613195 RepID=A0ABS2BH60_9NEIS|nr:lysis system i-spanin subunit Rz [Jeongeupia naejangsanensis]MBM3114958.1 lysis protein [Jeongeupia naejangsanensis]
MSWPALLKPIGKWLLYVLLLAGAISLIWLDGYRSSDAKWRLADQQRKARDTDAMAERINTARRDERAAAASQTAIATTYQERLQNEIADRDRAIADLRAGTRRLYVPVRAGSCEPVPTTAAAGRGGDGEARAELSIEAGEFLERLGSDADQLARQLDACQSTVLNDRRLINGTAERL